MYLKAIVFISSYNSFISFLKSKVSFNSIPDFYESIFNRGDK